MKTLFTVTIVTGGIKQGYDRPVSVTAAITRPLAPFAGICNNINVH